MTMGRLSYPSMTRHAGGRLHLLGMALNAFTESNAQCDHILPTSHKRGAIQIILTFTTCARPPPLRSNRDLESCLLCHPSSIFSFFFFSSLLLELSATIETEEGYHILLAHDLYPLLAICLIFQGNPPGSRIRSLGRSMVRLQPFRGLVIHETCRPCHVVPCSRTSPRHIRLHEGHERSAGEAREYLL